MSFKVGFKKFDRAPRLGDVAAPEFSDDYEADVIEMCSVLADASVGEFVLEGFGRRWPVDVAYDMSAFLEQFPSLLANIRSEAEWEVDLYSQGIESSLVFEPGVDDVLIHCRSRTLWTPDPPLERIERRELIGMLEELAVGVAKAFAEIAPAASYGRPFDGWARGVV